MERFAQLGKLVRSALGWLPVMVEVFSSLLKSRAALQLEKIALRHQIGVLQRSAKKRLQLHNSDGLFWVGLSQVWSEWRSIQSVR
jgi:putative transposase